MKSDLDVNPLKLFSHGNLNDSLEKYLTVARESYDGDKIHVVSFERKGFIEFTGQLSIEKDNLIGHLDYKKDVILVYDNGDTFRKYINMDVISDNRIERFPYFDEIEDLPPFDPPSIRYELSHFKD